VIGKGKPTSIFPLAGDVAGNYLETPVRISLNPDILTWYLSRKGRVLKII
jgi:hypothetical protein